ncbi:hypothetical protein NPIL_242881 [Nephila pilipes]|uniref:Uncharacterized protein n=1 Tax=Nephila pilipes TaxID=299642 RepID=A0A8X6P4K0_NEPPI|nr:hypothetical protein NPIL_242881 [Nephila pilipes]
MLRPMNVGFESPAQDYREMEAALRTMKRLAQHYRKCLVSCTEDDECRIRESSTKPQRALSSCSEDEESTDSRCLQMIQAKSSRSQSLAERK